MFSCAICRLPVSATNVLCPAEVVLVVNRFDGGNATQEFGTVAVHEMHLFLRLFLLYLTDTGPVALHLVRLTRRCRHDNGRSRDTSASSSVVNRWLKLNKLAATMPL